MEKMKMHSPNLTDVNLAKIRELFPGCVMEAMDENGKLRYAVDFDQLRQELSDHVIEGSQERYRLDWPGKREALTLANTPIAKALRPLRVRSVEFDETQNLFVEGDNLDALKLLIDSYLGKIKVIYIDPPYNTGSDFLYEDDFSEGPKEYFLKSNQVGDGGKKFIANSESNGRFHSDWISNLYARLKLARPLLRHDGVIFISISDKEFANLKKICDEIFGEENQIGTIVWNSTKSVTNTALISVGHTYNLVYARDKSYFVKNRSHFRLPEDGSGFENPDNDPRGPWKADPFQVGGWRPNQQYTIINPNTGEEYRPNPGSSWKNEYDKFKELMEDGRIVFGSSGEAGPQRKRFLSEATDRGKVSKTWWEDVGTTTNGTAHVKSLFGGKSVFSNPKPVDLIERFIELGDHTNEGIVLDFYAGSGTTAEAVMHANATKGARRTYILVQLDEKIDPNDKDQEAAVSYLNENGLPLEISIITQERIRLAAKAIAEKGRNFDAGYRLLRIDSSNMADAFYTAAETNQGSLLDAVENVKPERTDPEDLLFQVLVDWGVDLTLPIKKQKIMGKAVFFVNKEPHDLIACFDYGVTEELVKELAKHEPARVVFRDNGFASDAVKINVEQIFKQLSPATDVKSI